MNQLFPIVRRERRSLLPPDDVVVPAAAVATPSSGESVSDAVAVESAPAEQATVSPTVESSVPEAAPAQLKKQKRGANAQT